MKRLFILSMALLSSGCDEIRRTIDPDNYRARADSSVWASKNDILAAAALCEEPNIKPREVPGDTWSIETKDGNPISVANSQCIDRELDRLDLLVTR
jgi:hypothetical protein